MTEQERNLSSTNSVGLMPASHSSARDFQRRTWIMHRNKDAANLNLLIDTIQPRSNWETYLFGEVNQLIFQMTRMPDGHDFHLDADVARRAADLLGAIQANSRIDAPRVINEEGDTILFTWEDFGLKKYLCIDNEEVELRVRKPGTQFSTSEPLTHDGHVDISVLLNALGAEVSSGSVR